MSFKFHGYEWFLTTAIMMPKPVCGTSIKGHADGCRCELCEQYRLCYMCKRQLDQALADMHRMMHDRNMQLSEAEAERKAKNDAEMAELASRMAPMNIASTEAEFRRGDLQEGTSDGGAKRELECGVFKFGMSENPSVASSSSKRYKASDECELNAVSSGSGGAAISSG